jgi:hypothetical protein
MARAKALLVEALALGRELGEKASIAECLEGFAAIAVAQAQPERAARLIGAAKAIRDSINLPLQPIDRAALERVIADIHAQLDSATFEAICIAGRALSVEQAIAEALGS